MNNLFVKKMKSPESSGRLFIRRHRCSGLPSIQRQPTWALPGDWAPRTCQWVQQTMYLLPLTWWAGCFVTVRCKSELSGAVEHKNLRNNKIMQGKSKCWNLGEKARDLVMN